ncbi:MAG: NAD(P)/FAD-dependent oxidoreductase, partial [Myxococcales bacterium]|nr:NAD(P)/FAD-dependent oxidoreductase [Myxococcales bacterium]
MARARNGGNGADDRKDVRIAIIGAGMAGILSGIRLDEYGYHDYVIYEKSDRLGGTWRENTYPGLACDVPAHLYTYSFEPNPDWSSVFAPGPEIRAYFEKVASKYDIVEKIRFNEEVPYCEFVEGRWKIRTSTGREDEADVVIAASGVLHHPNVAQLPGLERFAGACFHSARWDHSVPLEGKRVGVVGTGSTAIQITSALVDKVAHYDLFQRTAQWIMPGDNPPYSEEQRATFRAHPDVMEAMRAELDRDFQRFANAVIDADSPAMQAIEDACRENLETNVRDPELREKLRPDYRAACKRLIFSPDFYEAIQHPNAELVTSGIQEVEPSGIRTEDGERHELDVLVMATGFFADRFIRPTTVLGRGGVNLDDVWADHPVAYLSISVPDFPNFFMLNGPNGPVGNFSLIQIAESQVSYVLQLIGQLRAGECREISASSEATAAFEHARAEAAKKSIWATGCKSWYLDKHGVPASWPWTPSRFFEEMASPNLEQFDRVR